MIDPLTGLTIDRQDPRGYVRLRALEYPLADTRGHVPRHRLILWEHLNRPITSRCTWCAYELPWRGDITNLAGLHRMRSVVHVDHLDGIPGHDDPANLVPACWWCNANRQWMEEELNEPALEKIRTLFAPIHPAERPNLPALMEAFTGQLPRRFERPE